MIKNFKSRHKNTHQDLGAYYLFYSIYLLITSLILIIPYTDVETFSPLLFWSLLVVNVFFGILLTWLFSKIKKNNGTNPWVYLVEKTIFKNRKGNQNKLVMSPIEVHQIQVDQNFDPAAVFYLEDYNQGALLAVKVTSSHLNDATWQILESQFKHLTSYHVLIVTRQIPETKNKTLEYTRLRNGQKIKGEIIDFIKNDSTENLLNIAESYQYFFTYNNLPTVDLRRYLFLNQKVTINGQDLTPSDTLGAGEKEQLGQKSNYESSDDDKTRSIKLIPPQIGEFAQKETYIYLIDHQKFASEEKFNHFKSILNAIDGLTFKLVPNYEAKSIFYESLLGENPNFLSTITHEKDYSIIAYQDSSKDDDKKAPSNLYLRPILISGFENKEAAHWLHHLLKRSIVGFNYTSMTYFGLMDKYGKRHILNSFYNDNKDKLKAEKKNAFNQNETETTEQYQKLHDELLKKQQNLYSFASVLIIKGSSYEHMELNFNYIVSEIQKMGYHYTTFDYQMERFFDTMRKGYFSSFANYIMDAPSVAKASPYLLSGGYSDDTGVIVGRTLEDNYPVKLDFYNFNSDNQIDVNIYKQIYGPHYQATYSAPHLMCIGGSGSGKSSLLKRIILESSIRGRKYMILDMENELINPFKQRFVMGSPDIKVFSFDNSDTLFFNPLSPINPIISSDDIVVNRIIELKKIRKEQMQTLKQNQLLGKNDPINIEESIYDQLTEKQQEIVRKDIIDSVNSSFWSLLNIINENNNYVLTEEIKKEWEKIIREEIKRTYPATDVRRYIDTGKFVPLTELSTALYDTVTDQNDERLETLKGILEKLKDTTRSSKFINGDQEIDFDDYTYIIFAMKELNQLLGETKDNDLPFAQLTYKAIINTVRDLMFSHKYYDEGVTFVIDEAHKIFTNNFKGFKEIEVEIKNTLAEIIRQGRKHNSAVYIATQSLSEILEMEKANVPFRDNMTFQFIRSEDEKLLDQFYSNSAQDQAMKKMILEAGKQERTFMVYNRVQAKPQFNKIKVFHPHFSAHYAKISGSEIHLPSNMLVQVADLDVALNPHMISSNSLEYFLLMATVYMLKKYHPKMYGELKWVDVYENWFNGVKFGDVEGLL